MSEIERNARHEAGHAIAAHAVGRCVVKLRCIPKVLAAEDPENPHDYPFPTDGFHQAEPLLGEEVVSPFRPGRPLPPELREWCLQDAVLCLAGPIAEGILGEDGSGQDIAEWAYSACFLEQVGEARPGNPFYDACVNVSETIIKELSEPLEVLIVRLVAEGEMDEEQIQEALAGTPNGSHRHLLKTLIS
jgi:hypothetical protein